MCQTMFSTKDYATFYRLKSSFIKARPQLFHFRLQVFSCVLNLEFMSYQSISPTELAERLKNKEDFRFIDVRELHEYEISRIEQAELLPLTQFNEWIGRLDPSEEIVVMCHHGIRSANVCVFLVRNGFEKVWNLDGGIDAWTAEVDSNVPRY